MSIPGKEIHRSYDEYGPIRVFEEGQNRYLAFGEDSQQSCINMLDPATLAYEYTQAMMLALVYAPKPERVTLLGLGAGSLIHSLHRYDSSIEIHVAELRAKVAEVAENWFGLEPNPLINIHIDDAHVYMNSLHEIDLPLKSDLIYADMYNDNGMIKSQLNPDFIQNCYEHLSREGILVLNLWDQGGGTHPSAIQILREHFSDNCMSCEIEGGNLIVYAFKGGLPHINQRHLQPVAKRLAKKLNLPAQRILQGFRVL